MLANWKKYGDEQPEEMQRVLVVDPKTGMILIAEHFPNYLKGGLVFYPEYKMGHRFIPTPDTEWSELPDLPLKFTDSTQDGKKEN